MKAVYMVKYMKENGEWLLYQSGTRLTPFTTENIGAAKAQATKLADKPYTVKVSILELDLNTNTIIQLDRYGNR